jgi:hypothetical protein
VITGLQAYRYYTAVRLHLTTEGFNVFKNPNIKCSLKAFEEKNTKLFFEKLGRRYDDPKKMVDFYVSNILYGNQDIFYNDSLSNENLKRWYKVKGSITYTFKNDLNKILQLVDKEDYYNSLLNLYLGQKINPETYFLLNELDNVIDNSNLQSKEFFQEDLLKIKKLKGFVRFDEQKIKKVYEEYQEELQSK